MSLIPLWLFYAIITGLASNGFNFFNRFLLRNGDDATTYAWYFQFIRFIVFGTFAVLNWQIVLTPYSILLFLLLGLTEFIGTYWYMKMHAYSDLSISSILTRTRLIWVPLIAFFVIGENIGLWGYVGIIIIFAGISLTVAPKKLIVDKGALYANLSSFIIAINVVITKMLIPYGSNFIIMTALALPSVFLFPIFMKNSPQRIKLLFKTNIILKTVAIMLSLIALYFFLAGLRIGDASKVNAVYQGMLIVSVVTGILFLKERKNITKKLLGATITVAGVVLLSFS